MCFHRKELALELLSRRQALRLALHLQLLLVRAGTQLILRICHRHRLHRRHCHRPQVQLL